MSTATDAAGYAEEAGFHPRKKNRRPSSPRHFTARPSRRRAWRPTEEIRKTEGICAARAIACHHFEYSRHAARGNSTHFCPLAARAAIVTSQRRQEMPKEQKTSTDPMRLLVGAAVPGQFVMCGGERPPA